MQLPLLEAGQLLLVVGISFAIITLIASTVRFHRLIQFSEEELKTVDDYNDFFYIQTTRYLSKITRTSSGFALLTIQFRTDEPELRPVQETLLHVAQEILREKADKACLFREDCLGLIIDTKGEQAERIARRITTDLAKQMHRVPEIGAFRVGAAAFPMHGQNTQLIIDTAVEIMNSVDYGEPLPVRTAPPPEEETETEEDAPEEPEKQEKNPAIDPLTGVLKSESIASYMRKYLADIRQKREPAAVICIGINKIDNIINLHGEEAADAVIAGVSQVLQRLTRDSDLIGRYHRTDFLILAPCSLEQGGLIAVRLREAVQKEVFPYKGNRMKASISAGITAHPEHGRTLRELFRFGHTALEIVREWDTSACLVYDPNQHRKKINI